MHPSMTNRPRDLSRGMKQPKWIESIEATDHWEAGYWVVRGWDREARMKATSVIDTIATNMMIAQPAQEMRVPIGGIAHAGVRGISKVERRVDNGEWMPAELGTPLSGQTWVIWRCDWPMQKGKHTFTILASRGTARRRSHEKLPRTRAASASSTRALSCSEETIPNRPELADAIEAGEIEIRIRAHDGEVPRFSKLPDLVIGASVQTNLHHVCRFWI